MKKFIFLIAVFATVRTFGQYVHFNNSYDLANFDSPPLVGYTCLIDSAYCVFGFNFTNDVYESVNTRLKTDLNGNMLSFFVDAVTDNPINFGGNPNHGGIVLPDSSVICTITSNYYCDATDDYKHAFGLTRYKDTTQLWEFTYPNLQNSCEQLKEYEIMGLQLIDDETFLAYSFLEVDSAETSSLLWTGIAFTYFDFDGNVISHYDHFDSEVPDNYMYLFPRENDIIAIGSTWPNSGQHVIAKFDYQANLLDSLHFGNSDIPINGGANGAIMDDGTMSYTYRYSTYWNPIIDINNVQQDVHFARIDLDNMVVLQDNIIPYPTDGLTLPNGSGSNACLKSSNNELVAVNGYVLDDQDFSDVHQLITKYSPTGEVIWQNEYDPPTAQNGSHTFTGLIEAPDGGYLASGESWEPDWTYRYTWLLKIDACGYEQPSGCPSVVGVAEQQQEPTMQLWPNPFTSTLKAVLPQNAERVFITDATGRVVFEERVFYPNQTWNLDGLANGLYVMRVVLENGIRISEMIVKQ